MCNDVYIFVLYSFLTNFHIQLLFLVNKHGLFFTLKYLTVKLLITSLIEKSMLVILGGGGVMLWHTLHSFEIFQIKYH